MDGDLVTHGYKNTPWLPLVSANRRKGKRLFYVAEERKNENYIILESFNWEYGLLGALTGVENQANQRSIDVS